VSSSKPPADSTLVTAGVACCSLGWTENDRTGALGFAPSLRFHAESQNSLPSTFIEPVKSGWFSVVFLSFFQIVTPLLLLF
jgi:hypothetical protein